MAGRLLAAIRESPRLIVSLPSNSRALAEAAAEGSADALKVHLNVQHAASGTHFGGLAEERANLEGILALGIPTGIVPGAVDCVASPEEMRALAEMGMDFFDMFITTMPAWLTRFSAMTRVGAVDQGVSPETVGEMEALGVEMLEAAVVPPDGYGRPLCLADLIRYRRLRAATKLPIIVPTERAITPDDVPLLLNEIGLNAIMIGAVVTGRDPHSVARATRLFADAFAAARG